MNVAARTRDFRLISPATKKLREAQKINILCQQVSGGRKARWNDPIEWKLNAAIKRPSAKTLQAPKKLPIHGLRRVPSYFHSKPNPPGLEPALTVCLSHNSMENKFSPRTLTLHPNNRSAHINIFVGRTQTWTTFPPEKSYSHRHVDPNIFKKALAFHRIRTWPIDNERDSTSPPACPLYPDPKIEASAPPIGPPISPQTIKVVKTGLKC
jgi:hypothetical protein